VYLSLSPSLFEPITCTVQLVVLTVIDKGAREINFFHFFISRMVSKKAFKKAKRNGL